MTNTRPVPLTPLPTVSEPRTLGFKDYQLENVYLRTTATQRSEIVDFWRRQGALRNAMEGARRSHEVVYLVRHNNGELAGVSTVSLKQIADRRRCYAYRMFLSKPHRISFLMRVITNATRDFLRDFAHPQDKPMGLLITTENRKLMRPGIKRYFARHGYLYQGRNRHGLDMWYVAFNNPGNHGKVEHQSVDATMTTKSIINAEVSNGCK